MTRRAPDGERCASADLAMQWVRSARGYEHTARRVAGVTGAYAGLAVLASSYVAWLTAATFALAYLLDGGEA